MDNNFVKVFDQISNNVASNLAGNDGAPTSLSFGVPWTQLNQIYTDIVNSSPVKYSWGREGLDLTKALGYTAPFLVTR